MRICTQWNVEPQVCFSQIICLKLLKPIPLQAVLLLSNRSNTYSLTNYIITSKQIQHLALYNFTFKQIQHLFPYKLYFYFQTDPTPIPLQTILLLSNRCQHLFPYKLYYYFQTDPTPIPCLLYTSPSPRDRG